MNNYANIAAKDTGAALLSKGVSLAPANIDGYCARHELLSCKMGGFRMGIKLTVVSVWKEHGKSLQNHEE